MSDFEMPTNRQEPPYGEYWDQNINKQTGRPYTQAELQEEIADALSQAAKANPELEGRAFTIIADMEVRAHISDTLAELGSVDDESIYEEIRKMEEQ